MQQVERGKESAVLRFFFSIIKKKNTKILPFLVNQSLPASPLLALREYVCEKEKGVSHIDSNLPCSRREKTVPVVDSESKAGH